MVEKYDYLNAMKADIREYLNGMEYDKNEPIDIDNLEYEILMDDSVTGSRSETYTCNRKQEGF